MVYVMKVSMEMDNVFLVDLLSGVVYAIIIVLVRRMILVMMVSMVMDYVWLAILMAISVRLVICIVLAIMGCVSILNPLIISHVNVILDFYWTKIIHLIVYHVRLL